MRTLVLMLLLASPPNALAEELKLRTGKITRIGPGAIALDGTLHIGFVAEAPALRELEAIAVGDVVLATFGSAPSPRGPGRINKLLAIRRCAEADAGCDEARAKMDAENAALDRHHAKLRAESDRCDRAMEATLAKDPRHVPRAVPDAAPPGLLDRYNALKGRRKACASRHVRDHRQAVSEACELHQCGQHVAGGCAHITGYSTHSALFERALAHCTAVERK
jgi:hypothetical protein